MNLYKIGFESAYDFSWKQKMDQFQVELPADVQEKENFTRRIAQYIHFKYINKYKLEKDKFGEYNIFSHVHTEIQDLVRVFTSEGEDSYFPLARNFVVNVLYLDDKNHYITIKVAAIFSRAPKIVIK